eukprot:13561992-Heterocapsa_arctica.AAC.1
MVLGARALWTSTRTPTGRLVRVDALLRVDASSSTGTLVATWSRTQPVVTLSTAESELMAMGTAVQEGQFVQHILEELR